MEKLFNDPEPEYYDDMRTADGREFRLLYDPEPSIVEVNSKNEPWSFPTIQQVEQAWVDLQALFGVKSRLASDPEWDQFPKPTAPSIQ
jgi:hypothetical protein